jgi:hypothetical protein
MDNDDKRFQTITNSVDRNLIKKLLAEGEYYHYNKELLTNITGIEPT